jgi:hypothetical protein
VTLPSPLAGPVTGESVPADPGARLESRVFLGGRDAAARVRTAQGTTVNGGTPHYLAVGAVAGSPYTGKGATVAIVLDARSPAMEADASRFFAAHGVAGFKPGRYTENRPPGSDRTDWPDGDNPEEALDVETVHIIAPDAKVVFVSAGCDYGTYDFLDAHTRVVDSDLADVVSDSRSGIEGDTSPALVRLGTRAPAGRDRGHRHELRLR